MINLELLENKRRFSDVCHGDGLTSSRVVCHSHHTEWNFGSADLLNELSELGNVHVAFECPVIVHFERLLDHDIYGVASANLDVRLCGVKMHVAWNLHAILDKACAQYVL